MYNIHRVTTTLHRVLMTGASGALGRLLAPALAVAGALRTADLVPTGDDTGVAEVVLGDLADPHVAARAVEGVEAIVHLAGIPTAGTAWGPLVQANLLTTATLLDEAARAGVTRLVLASSVHVTGGYGDPADWPVGPERPARPCCRYGVSKATTELLAQRFAADRRGVSAVALRLGLVADRPRWTREAKGWTPSAALAPLVGAALTAAPGYQVHYAVARAERPRYDLTSLVRDLGATPPDPWDDEVPLPSARPAYAAECALWATPTSNYT